jgi:hypothetical protein
MLAEVGFENPSIEPTRVYSREDAVALLTGTGVDVALAEQVEGKVMSGFVRATKPGTPRAHKPKVSLAQLAKTGAESQRECGCASDCCT